MIGYLKKILKRHPSFSMHGRMERKIDLLRRKGVRIGENVALYNVLIDENFPFLIEIGANCVITHATLLAHDSSPLVFEGKRVIAGRIRIHDNCFIGAGAVILPGVEIGPNSVVGANSVVTKDVPENSIASGNPAKVLSSVSDWLKQGQKSERKHWISSGFGKNVPEDAEMEDLAGNVRRSLKQKQKGER